MNSTIKNYIERSCNLVEFLHHFQRALNHSRYNEVKADYKSLHTEPVLTTALKSIEKSVANVYTGDAFWLFHNEIIAARACFIRDREQITRNGLYYVNKFCKQGSTWEVLYYKSANKFKCSCGKLESFGFPCQHIVCVMVQEMLESCISKRWTKKAK